jgi:hypothetical protein
MYHSLGFCGESHCAACRKSGLKSGLKAGSQMNNNHVEAGIVSEKRPWIAPEVQEISVHENTASGGTNVNVDGTKCGNPASPCPS